MTARSFGIGLVLAACHTVWIIYEEAALGHLGVAFTTFMLVQSAVGVLFGLVLVNSLLKRISSRWMLHPAELMVVFCMVTVSAVISGFDLLQTLFSVLLWPRFFGGPTDGFEPFLEFVPSYFAPTDAQVVRGFFTGSQDEWRFFDPEVLRHWIVPMLFWGGFLLLIACTMLCLSSLMRRQWIDRERLEFPIIELPLMMARANTAGALLRDPLLSLGFGLTAALLMMNCFAGLYPQIPDIPLNVTNIGRSLFVNPPLSGMNPVYVAWWPYAIGLCYLMPLDISFSCWFFYVMIRLAAAFGTAQGWRQPNAAFAPDQFPYFQNLAYGAWIGMFFVVIWSARRSLAQAVRQALRGEPEETRGELMTSRAALIGAATGFGILVVVSVISGVRPHIALLFFTLYFLLTIVMTRIYAQVAVPLFELAMISTTPLMTSLTGTSALNRQDAAILTQFYWFNRTYRQHPMGHEMESLAAAQKLGQSPRSMLWPILGALAVGIAVGMVTLLQIYYSRGAASAQVNAAQVSVGWEAWAGLSRLADSHPPQASVMAGIAASAGLVFALVMARNAWFAFPLHPVGYAFACSYAMEYIWAVVLITWTIKLAVTHYGGLRLYRRTLPFFYGMVLADAVTQMAWGIAGSIFGIQGTSAYGEMKW